MNARLVRLRRWWVTGLLVPALVAPLGCNEPREIIPVAPPGVPLVRIPTTPQTEAQALGEPGTTAPLEKAVPRAQVSSTAKSLPTAVGVSTKTPSGLEYVTVKEGTGATAEPGQVVTMHYVGTLPDGTQFDSSRDRGKPFDTVIGAKAVIDGWDEGVPGMKVGEVRKLIIPGNLAYGKKGFGTTIPPDATLLFEVELLGVK